MTKSRTTSTRGEGDRLGRAANDLLDEAGQTAEVQVSNVMTVAGEALAQVADAVRQSGAGLRDQQPMLADVASTAAQRVEDASSYLREHDAREVLQRAEDFARRQPAVVIAGGLALGLALGRFLRSAQPDDPTAFGYGVRRGYGYGGTYGSSGAGYRERDPGGVRYGAAGAAGMTEGAVAGTTGYAGATAYAGTPGYAGATGYDDAGAADAYGTSSGSTARETAWDTDRVAAIGGSGAGTGYEDTAYGSGIPSSGADPDDLRTSGSTRSTDGDRDQGG